MKTREMVALTSNYGRDCTLGEILDIYLKNLPFICPKCNGNGRIRAVSDGGEEKECDLCNGEGYTKYRMVPKMVVDGWEPASLADEILEKRRELK